MTHQGISFEIRADLGWNEWTLLVSFPDRTEPSVSQASGSRGDAIAIAHKQIEGWLTRQRQKTRASTYPSQLFSIIRASCRSVNPD